MSNRVYRFIIFALIVLLSIVAVQAVSLSRQVREMERQAGEDIMRTINMLDDIQTFIAVQLDKEDVDFVLLQDLVGTGYTTASRTGMPALAYYYERMQVELLADDGSDEQALAGTIKELNEHLGGLLALVLGKDAEVPRTAQHQFLWVTGQDKEFSAQVTDYIRSRK